MVKLTDDCRRPFLSTDRNHFQADTTRALGEHLRQNQKNLTSGLGGDMITRKRLLTGLWTYERLDAG